MIVSDAEFARTLRDAAEIASEAYLGHLARCRKCRARCGCPSCATSAPLCPLGRRLDEVTAERVSEAMNAGRACR